MNLTFQQRADKLGADFINHGILPDKSSRQGKLTYLVPGDTWQPNDFYESEDGVHVVGANSRAKVGDKVDAVWMRVEPRRYVGVKA